MSGNLNYAFDHVHLYCSDVAASERWFVDVMGAEVVRHRTANDAPVTDLRIGGVNVFLFTGDKTANAPGREHLGTEHFGLRVENLAATAEELRRRGVQFDVEPKQTRPDLSIAFVKGPDNVRIELLQRG